MMRKDTQINKDPFHVFTEEMREIIVNFLLNCREYRSENGFIFSYYKGFFSR